MRLLHAFLTATLLALLASRIPAADATFSREGQQVHLVEYGAPTLTTIDIATETASELDLGAFTHRQGILAVSLSTSGNLLFVTAKDAWAYDFERKSCSKLCSSGADSEFEDLAYDPESGAILFSIRKGSEHGALYLKHDAAKPLPVFMRRVSTFEGMAFSPTGELFFGARGDLWVGSILPEEEEPKPTRVVLEGTRCAPLATLETYVGTPSQIGVQKVAVAGDRMYVHLHRMGGSGWGNIVRLLKPPSVNEDDLKKRLELYAKEVSSVEVLGENGTISYLCASPDGKRVFFTTNVISGDMVKAYLVEDDGMPRELKVKLTK